MVAFHAQTGLSRIEAQVSSGAFAETAETLLAGGPRLGPVRRSRLLDPQWIAATALGLTLREATSRTRRPSPLAERLADALLREQRSDGTFAEGESSVAVTAAALSGLCRLLDQLERQPGRLAGQRFMSESVERRLRAGVNAALNALGSLQWQGTSASPLGSVGDEDDTALVLWLLGGTTSAARGIDFDALLDAADRRGLRHDRIVKRLIEDIGRAAVVAA